MKLSILITHYDEPKEVYEPLLKSIAMQQGVDFNEIEVVVANDCKEKAIDPRELSFIPCETKCVYQDHKGISANRNLALDNSTGEYVMWIDCDDILYSLYGLYMVFGKIKNGFDMLISTFVEEQKRDGKNYRLIRHDNDFTFIHGKVFRREFLDENDLRFNPSLTIHEDGYFVSLCALTSEGTATLDNPFHLWRWNENSVVRREDEQTFLMQTYKNLVEARIAFCSEAEKRGFISDYFDGVCKTILDAYYEFQKPKYLDKENERYVKRAKRAFKKFYDKYKDAYKECNITRIAEIMTICRNNAFASGLRIESQSLHEFLTEIANME